MFRLWFLRAVCRRILLWLLVPSPNFDAMPKTVRVDEHVPLNAESIERWMKSSIQKRGPHTSGGYGWDHAIIPPVGLSCFKASSRRVFWRTSGIMKAVIERHPNPKPSQELKVIPARLLVPSDAQNSGDFISYIRPPVDRWHARAYCSLSNELSTESLRAYGPRLQTKYFKNWILYISMSYVLTIRVII